MKRNLIYLLVIGLSCSVLKAQEVSVWQTLFDDGSARERELEVDDYARNQDDGYVLLKKMPSLRFQEKTDKSERVISIDVSSHGQTIQGLGAAMTDSSAWLLSQLKVNNSELYQYALHRLFSEDGAGFSVLRRPIGSSDYTATQSFYTYEDEQSQFSIEHDKEYIIPVLKDVLAINPSIQIIGSPWSPPAWMKTNRKARKLMKAGTLQPDVPAIARVGCRSAMHPAIQISYGNTRDALIQMKATASCMGRDSSLGMRAGGFTRFNSVSLS